MHRTVSVIAIVACMVLAVACSSGEPEIEVGEAQAASPIAGSSQIVLELRNVGDGDDRLVEASTPAALGASIHLTEVVEGRATMTELDGIDVPAGESVRFRPGHLHLMLDVPDATVVVGASFELTLTFDRSEPITVPVEVVELLDLTEPDDDV